MKMNLTYFYVQSYKKSVKKDKKILPICKQIMKSGI